jgi:hypothetical protein
MMERGSAGSLPAGARAPSPRGSLGAAGPAAWEAAVPLLLRYCCKR